MLFEQIRQNKRKTIFVILAYLLLFLVIGAAVGTLSFDDAYMGMGLMTIIGLVYTFIMLQRSTEIVMKMNHAVEITSKEQAPMLWNIVEDMALVAHVPVPRIFIVSDDSPNAFATGPDPQHAAVAVTEGLLRLLNREELEAVIGHEFGHIRNYDIRLQTITVALGAVISLAIQFSPRLIGTGSRNSRDREESGGGIQILFLVLSLVALVLGPITATIIQMALSRNREYLADASSVEFTRNPAGLISALKKISQAPPLTQADRQSASLYITNPFKEEGEMSEEKDSLFATHPSTANRIKRLRQM